MRSLKLASFLLLAGTVTMACSSDGSDGGDGDGDGGGVGAAPGTGGSMSGTGGGTTGTGSVAGDGDGDGTGGMTANSACTNTVVATGTPAMIDDFESEEGFPNFPDDSDGRVGTWEHESWNPAEPNGERIFADPELVDGAMHFSCDGGDDEDMVWHPLD